MSRRLTCHGALLAAAFTIAACAGDRTPDASSAADTAAAVDTSMALVIRGASIAIAVDSAPAAADSILRAAGMTAEAYDELMYQIASDSALSRMFEEALRGRRR